MEELYFVVAAKPIPNLERAAGKGIEELADGSLANYVELDGSKGIGRIPESRPQPSRRAGPATYAVGELRIIHLP